MPLLPQLNLDMNFDDLENVPGGYDKNYSKDAGVPLRFVDCTFENTENECSAKVKKFTDFGKGILIIYGPNGTGKTRTACCAINHRIAQHVQAGDFISCGNEVCPMIRSSRSFKADRSEYETLKYYYTTPFLVIDEVGKGDDSVIAKMFVTNVLAARYNNQLPTLMTTNLTKDELMEFLGKDIEDRLAEVGSEAVLMGKNYRRGN